MTRLLRKQAAIRSAVRRGLLGAERPVCMFFDLDDFTEQIRSLKEAFPSNFEHCMAVKAQPTRFQPPRCAAAAGSRLPRHAAPLPRSRRATRTADDCRRGASSRVLHKLLFLQLRSEVIQEFQQYLSFRMSLEGDLCILPLYIFCIRKNRIGS